jgi:hypothetical protein
MCIYHPITCSSYDGGLSCFHPLAIVRQAAMRMVINMLLDVSPEVGLLDHKVGHMHMLAWNSLGAGSVGVQTASPFSGVSRVSVALGITPRACACCALLLSSHSRILALLSVSGRLLSRHLHHVIVPSCQQCLPWFHSSCCDRTLQLKQPKERGFDLAYFSVFCLEALRSFMVYGSHCNRCKVVTHDFVLPRSIAREAASVSSCHPQPFRCLLWGKAYLSHICHCLCQGCNRQKLEKVSLC